MKRLFCTLLVLCWLPTAYAFEPFEVKDIKLEGLQRISVGTVFNYFPIKPGDTLDNAQAIQAIQALYSTGFFKDIQLEREGNVLVVFVAERPAINNIEMEGYDTIPKDQLEDELKKIGIVKGRVFNRSVLENLTQAMERQYYALGKYGVKIDTELTALERNRVDIKIKIAEGDTAEIYAVNIIGNKAYSDESLVKRLSLAEPSTFNTRNKYEKQQLAADLEALKSYYLDRGYLNFSINSTQVSLGPDKQSVYVTINITEGNKYTIRDVKLAGDLILPQKEMAALVSIKAGDIFSRREITDSTKALGDRLAEEGYAFANVNMVPDVDKDSRTVALTFFVDPGRRFYVRRINVAGNTKTKDQVIRREMRQLEGDWLSTSHVSRSKTRLDRLGFFDEVAVETKRVPGTLDQVDLNYTVTERPTGSLQAGVGYSDSQGAIVNFALTQDNFMGTGQRVGMRIDNSSVTKTYSFDFTNPYYTDEGVSRGFSISYRNINAEEADISNYSTDSYGASLYFGIPVSELDTVQWGVKYDTTEITTGALGSTSQYVLDFISYNGTMFDTYQLFGSWAHDTRNRRIFATEGSLTSLGGEVAVPGSDLQYYKLDIRHLHYFPFGKEVSLAANLNIGYGKGYGSKAYMPPYENYFAGGSRTVRGYSGNSLGPRDALTNDPIGGNIKVIGNLDLILPNPFTEQSNSTRVSLFADAGNVFTDKVDSAEFRYTAGLSFIWLTPVGAMRFNFSTALNEKPGDLTESFQFSLGSPF